MCTKHHTLTGQVQYSKVMHILLYYSIVKYNIVYFSTLYKEVLGGYYYKNEVTHKCLRPNAAARRSTADLASRKLMRRNRLLAAAVISECHFFCPNWYQPLTSVEPKVHP